MAVAVNPYPQHQLQLGVLETGLRSLKTAKELMTDQEFSGMYWAIERHHRDLKLAHLTGKSKDILDQAQKDTKFYNILIKMLCEVKKLPIKKQRDSLKKVHSWYLGNRHTLQLGPRFGKTSQKLEAEDILKNAKHAAKFQTASAKQTSDLSRQSSAVKTRKHSGREKIKSAQKGGGDFRQFIHDTREQEEDVSTPQGHRESVFPMSDLGSNFTGNDFLTSRFLSELPMSKLSWNLDSPLGKSQTPTDWEGTEAELQRIQESALSAPVFSDLFHHSHRSSHGSHDNDSVVSHGSDSNVSSRVDAGSLDMMDFSSDVRRRLSRGQTPSASLRAGGMSGMTPDESSTEVYGLQKRMVHSIASLVNPHAKLAEAEAKRAEQEYYQNQGPNATASRQSFSRSATKVNVPNSSKGESDYGGQTPVLRPVSVMGNRVEALQNFQSFSKDHLYGQDILSKLNFVGRSGTALDVRYCAHDQGDMPENHTKELINLYGITSDDNEIKPHVIQSEGNIHEQPLEEFYQTADTIYPTHLPKYTGSSTVRNRIKSAPAQRTKTARPFKTPLITEKGSKKEKMGSSRGHRTPGGKVSQMSGEANKENEQFVERPKSAIKLDAVVNMIDSVKDEMYFFKEKLAPNPMPGFRQPAHVGVPTKPLSRPATAKSGRSIPRGRSPSPQQRPSTPTDQDHLMMDEGEVAPLPYQPNAFPARPHSATVNRAVDWRGKVTPDAGKYKSKTRFGGHTYVKKMKPSLRTAGAVVGKRPKTAPVNVRDKWKTEKNYPGAVNAIPYPYYPVKRLEPPSIVITENDKNTRVPQAASNTVVEVDQKDVDTMLNISYLTGHSDSRYGSMASLYLDEEFLRSLGSHYTPVSPRTVSQNTTKEYLSLIGPTPMTPTGGSRAQSRQGQRKPETSIDQIPEESTVRADSLQVEVGKVHAESGRQHAEFIKQRAEDEQGIPTGLSAGQELERVTDNKVDSGEDEAVTEKTVQEQDSSGEKGTEELPQERFPNLSKVEIDNEAEEIKVDTLDSGTQTVKFPREPAVIHTETQEDNDVHIEVTAIPAFGPASFPPEGADLEKLSKSETWQFQPDLDTHVHTFEHESWSQNIVKPENYCFECIPRGMAAKVGRSAGRMPGGTQSPAGQVLRMSRKQNEYFKKAPPVRTPPSIPSPHHPLGGRSPRQGQQYMAELEQHARKDKSPRHFIEKDTYAPPSPRPAGTIRRGSPGKKMGFKKKMVELRKDTCRSAPVGARKGEDNDMASALIVISLRTQGRAKTAPALHGIRQSESFLVLQPFPEETEEETLEQPSNSATDRSGPMHRTAPTTASQSIAHIGRPIAQVSRIPDPTEVEEAVIKQKQAKAAVDIQRIFRGYVCRSSYNKLLWENRKKAEDKQMVMVETHREFRKHQERKARIYNRPPLDPALLQWARDFKQIQMQNHGKRQEKRDIMAKEMLANQVKQKSKIELIGPHVEIYDIYHPKEIGPTKREMHVAAVLIQKQIRGFLVRRRFEKLRRKATFCGSTWKKMVKEYKSQLLRVQQWHGVERPKSPFSVDEMSEYMDMRRRYESQFDKKAFGEELELEELESFFHECDLYPSNMEIDDGIDVIFQGRSLKGHGLKKQDAMNLLFYIYVPPATGLENTRQSTWMNPIVDGVEAKKLMGAEFMQKTPLKVCADLVMTSKRERREKEEVERQRQLEEEERKSVQSEGSQKSSDSTKQKHGKLRRTSTSDDLKQSGKSKRTTTKSTKITDKTSTVGKK